MTGRAAGEPLAARLGRDFRPVRDERYNLPAGTLIQSAKFGRTRVDVWPDAEPGAIWRGEPKRIVGRWPGQLWRFVVHGEMSGVSASEAGAKAEAERRAWESEANFHVRIAPHAIPYRHQQDADARQADRDAFAAMLAEIDRRFPES